MQIIDLSVPIGEDTLSPPSVSFQLQLTIFHRGPGFWQACPSQFSAGCDTRRSSAKNVYVRFG